MEQSHLNPVKNHMKHKAGDEMAQSILNHKAKQWGALCHSAL